MLAGLIAQGFSPANWPSRCQSWHGNRAAIRCQGTRRQRSVRLSAAHVVYQVYLELHIVRKLLEHLARIVLVEQQVGKE